MFCGIDVGTQGVRVAIVDADGRQIGAAERALPPGERAGGKHTQLPDSWWGALVPAVRDAVAAVRENGANPIDIAALALDATSGTVLVEAPDGTALGAALMYDDSRAAAEAELVDRVGRVLWRRLGYRMQPSWALPKVCWLLTHDAVPARGRVVHQADFLVGRLAGHPVATDISTALKTGVDLIDVAWPAELLNELGVGRGVLPDAVMPGTIIAAVGDEAARLTGLPAGAPIHAGMTDGCAAQIAAGALDPGSWSSALGTTLTVKGSTTNLVLDPDGAVYCHRHPDGGWLPGGASSTGAGAIRAAFPDADAARLRELTAAAAERADDGPVVYPLTGSGERFPFVAPQAHGFGLDSCTDDVERFAAICRGIAFVERLGYDVLATRGADVNGTVALTGATSANGWWNQLRADLLGLPTTRPASAQAAVGMAVLAAAQPGELAATTHRMVRQVERLDPDPERGAALHSGYRAFVADLADRGWLDSTIASAALDRLTTAGAGS